MMIAIGNSISGSSSLGSGQSAISHSALLAEFVAVGDTVEDISGTGTARNPRNLHAINPFGLGTNASGSPFYPNGSDTNFTTSTPFTICARFKSSSALSFNSILNNEAVGSTYKGINFGHQVGGGASFHMAHNNFQYALQAFTTGTFFDVNGNSVTLGTRNQLNNGQWHFIAITYTGVFAAANIRWYVDKAVAQTSGNTAGSNISIATTQPWIIGRRIGDTNHHNITVAEVAFYNVAKTHAELIAIEDGEVDTVGLLRYYKNEEESGSVIYNHYVTNIADPKHGTISGVTPNTARVSGSGRKSRSFANRYGFNLNGSVVVPANLAAPTQDVLGNALTNSGKVKYPTSITSTSPLTFKPNPSGYDELTDLGLTSSTTITAGTTVFRNSEVANPFFKNAAETKFLVFFRPLRHFANLLGSDEIGSVLTYLSIKTYLIGLHGQSNAVGSNNSANGDAFVTTSYGNTTTPYAFITNNNDSNSVAQSVSRFLNYNPDVNTGNDRGNQYGADASLLKDLVTAGRCPYLYKYAVSATSMFSGGSLHYWHPTSRGGSGNALYPLMIPGYTAAINLLRANGRSDIEVIFFWDQGEANIGQAGYQTALEALDTQLKVDVPEYKGKFILRRVHTPYVLSNDILRTQQDAFAAAAPAVRKSINSDDCASWDVSNVHIRIQGQEIIGQRVASTMIAAGWL
jgi:hypothetical protein